MFGRGSDYMLVSQTPGSNELHSGSASQDAKTEKYYRTTYLHSKAYRIGLVVIGSVSVILNILFLASCCMSMRHHATGQTPYARLEFDQDQKLWWNTPFSALDSTDAEITYLWNKTMPWESGIIAIDDHEAQAMGLPESQPFPWDMHEKSLYIINAHHILHCVRNLYLSLYEYRHDMPQSVTYPHLLHCLDSIRIETMCTADDTPRYVPKNSIHGFKPGDSQTRKCRDWNKLQAWVDGHDPCYRYIEPGNEDLNNLERFKYCANDSQYLPKIRQYFGLGEDWIPDL